ncbi:MAG: bifunctional ornithine acetyltransferase/N-acetylglutamate synthase, partial [Chloroflexi bacterium]|nr:bifunctional ornithine acetyltransferase/N-acetylglutamate synthase [Chloroflexota bacterium]
AVHGNDPNWGRLLAAVGRSGAEMEESKLDLFLSELCLTKGGCPQPFDMDAAVGLLKGAEVSFRIYLNLGGEKATAWGCDLSEEYVTINSTYST